MRLAKATLTSAFNFSTSRRSRIGSNNTNASRGLRRKIIGARNNPLFAAYGKPWLQSYLGAGKKPRRAWNIMAYILAGLMLEAS
jgi:hypothetical protein